ncbi:hypothetical protein J6590_039723 [Homalodisca vitripennis]|nr:hypothetical protein J6590_039723 [Homalodisca vitripennis]
MEADQVSAALRCIQVRRRRSCEDVGDHCNSPCERSREGQKQLSPFLRSDVQVTIRPVTWVSDLPASLGRDRLTSSNKEI